MQRKALRPRINASIASRPAACSLLHFPELGPERSDIAADARMLVIERWIALYRLVEQGVQIVRIVDGTRDLSRLIAPQE